MRMTKFNDQVKIYLTRLLKQFEGGELTPHEVNQLFQDLADTGFGWQIGKEYSDLLNKLILSKKILSPNSGYIPDLKEITKVKRILN